MVKPMRLLSALLGCALLLPALPLQMGTAWAQGGKLKPRPELLVQGEWLAARLKEPGLRVVDLRSRADYRAGHIPGAVHMAITALSAPREGVGGMLPPAEEVQATFRAAGIGPKTIVVAYGDSGGLFAARLFWALDYLGQGRGRVLDGGWRRWVGARRPVTREIPRISASAFVARPNPSKIATLDWVGGHLEDDATALVDARHPTEYTGAVRYSRRGGHIPGARLFNWSGHLNPGGGGRLKSLDELGDIYAAMGLPAKREVVVYCQTLMRAAHTYFVLKLLGYTNVRGYDGSWEEWGNRRDTPVRTGREAPPRR